MTIAASSVQASPYSDETSQQLPVESQHLASRESKTAAIAEASAEIASGWWDPGLWMGIAAFGTISAEVLPSRWNARQLETKTYLANPKPDSVQTAIFPFAGKGGRRRRARGPKEGVRQRAGREAAEADFAPESRKWAYLACACHWRLGRRLARGRGHDPQRRPHRGAAHSTTLGGGTWAAHERLGPQTLSTDPVLAAATSARLPVGEGKDMQVAGGPAAPKDGARVWAKRGEQRRTRMLHLLSRFAPRGAAWL